MRRLIPSSPVRAAALIACVGFARCAFAQTDCDANGVPDANESLLWVGGPPFAEFSDDQPWLNLGFGVSQSPQPGSLCLFDALASGVDPALAHVGGDAIVRGLAVVSGEVRLDFAQGRTLTVTGALAGCRETVVGLTPGALASAVLTGSGGLVAGRLTLGSVGQSSGMISLNGAGVSLSAGVSVIGDDGTGSLVSAGSAVEFRGPLSIGEDALGLVEVSGGAGDLLFSSSLGEAVVIGRRGQGTLRLRDGAFAATTGVAIELVLGSEPGSVGGLSLIGPGTLAVLDTTTFDVGRVGMGGVTIRSGGVLRTTSPDGVSVGREPGSVGEVAVFDGVWDESGAPVFVGRLGFGRVFLDDLGEFVGDARVLRRGLLAGSGTVRGPMTIAGGRLLPGMGSSSRSLLVDGDLSFRGLRPSTGLVQNGRLEVRLDGALPVGFDSVHSIGVAELAGTLVVRGDSALSLPVGATATVLTADGGRFGVFGAVSVPVFDNGTTLAVDYGPGEVVLRVVASEGRPPVYDEPRGFAAAGALPQTSAVVGDVTGDGQPDLVVVATGDAEGRLVVLRNLGVDQTGAWLGFAAPTMFGTVEREPVGVALGDINQDGLPDAVFVSKATNGGGVVRVRLNSPMEPGEFPAFFGNGVVIENDPVDLALSDLNDDGIPDPAVAGIVPGSSQQPLPGGAGRMTSTGRVTTVDLSVATADDIDVGVQPGSIDTYTSDQPGDTDDIAVTCTGEGVVITLQNDGAGGFPTMQVISVGVDPTGLDTADVDGDGQADLLTTNTASGTVSVARSIPGSSPIAFGTSVTFATDDADGSEPVSGVWADLDDDGDLDIALIARDDGGAPRIRRLLFDGVGTSGELRFQDVVDAAPPAPGEPMPIELLSADVDSDGVEDLIVIYADAAGSIGAERLVPLATADVGVRLGSMSCPADLAAPFGVLDLADIDAFIVSFIAGESRADLAPPFGLLDLADIDAFITGFVGGCP